MAARPGFCRCQPIEVVARVTRPRPPVPYSWHLLCPSVSPRVRLVHLEPAASSTQGEPIGRATQTTSAHACPLPRMVSRSGLNLRDAVWNSPMKPLGQRSDSRSYFMGLFNSWYVKFDNLKDKTNSFLSLASRIPGRPLILPFNLSPALDSRLRVTVSSYKHLCFLHHVLSSEFEHVNPSAFVPSARGMLRDASIETCRSMLRSIRRL